MKIVIDDVKCVGHGVCESLADDLFEVGDDGYAHALVDEVPAEREAMVRQCVGACPAQALSLAD